MTNNNGTSVEIKIDETLTAKKSFELSKLLKIIAKEVVERGIKDRKGGIITDYPRYLVINYKYNKVIILENQKKNFSNIILDTKSVQKSIKLDFDEVQNFIIVNLINYVLFYLNSNVGKLYISDFKGFCRHN